MASQDTTQLKQAAGRKLLRWRRPRGALVLLMGCLAIIAPFFAGSLGLFLVGLMLVGCGILEMLETFYTPDDIQRRATYQSGAFTIGIGILLLAQPHLVLRGLGLLLAGMLFLDGLSKLAASWRSHEAGLARTGGVI